MKRRILSKRTLLSVASGVVAIGLIGTSTYMLLQRYSATHKPSGPPSTQIITHSTNTPDESVPTAGAYNVAPDQPKTIDIPSLGIQGYIQKVGVDQNKQVGVPSNVHYAGWFVDSVKPGDTGLSIIDGHVGARYTQAIFKELSNLKKMDQFTVEYGDGTSRTFEVVEKRELPVDETASFLFHKDPGIVAQLNLITCGGNLDKQSGTYDKRVVVVSKRVG